MPDLVAIEARADIETGDIDVTLSPASFWLLCDLLQETDRFRWGEISDSDWDTAQAIIAQADEELSGSA